jgi:small subunit ribosomal protein S20
VKQLETALAAGDKDQAQAAMKKVQPELARGVAKGVFHKNTASRKISRLSKRVAALG